MSVLMPKYTLHASGHQPGSKAVRRAKARDYREPDKKLTQTDGFTAPAPPIPLVYGKTMV